ncbi:hypothetical protein CIB95_02175 [Lottiidibacillus patelloidae]|uniref:Uncharacterized protein n=1 Tax=Lottiidibacillus patelloidae TaxID=2670334 RepID=A0A263BXT6_9BACI|nr:hypothetical protein CIB95_02175 [Lottiidibacillus patelloidae]
MKIYYFSVIIILSVIGLYGIWSEAENSGHFNGSWYLLYTVPSVIFLITFMTTNTKENYKKIILTSFIKIFVIFEILFVIGMVYFRGLDSYKYAMTIPKNLIEHSIFLVILLMIFLTISLPYVFFKKRDSKS